MRRASSCVIDPGWRLLALPALAALIGATTPHPIAKTKTVAAKKITSVKPATTSPKLADTALPPDTSDATTAPATGPEAAPANKVAVAIRGNGGGKLKTFYRARGYWPMWVHGDAIGPEAGQFLALLSSANLDGLSPKAYDVEGLHKVIDAANSGDPQALAHADIKLSLTFADYVRDVRDGPAAKITYLDAELEPGKITPDTTLRVAALAPSFGDYVKNMVWMSPLYVNLRRALGKTHDDPNTERVIRTNMARARLLPGPFTRHVVVDAASAQLWYYDKGALQGTMRVVVGAPTSQTPMLAGMVRYAILNPYWNIPPDLVQKKVAPKILAGASLTGLHYEVLSDWSANPAPLDPKTIDWHAVADGSTELRVRQLPGGTNAMGRVKFMFPNNLGIYLHDTPEKVLLTKPQRHLSNGCVRLQDAPRLGKWFFGKPLSTTSKTPEQILPLPAPVPVYLTYLTATPTTTGVALLDDVYGRDEPQSVSGAN